MKALSILKFSLILYRRPHCGSPVKGNVGGSADMLKKRLLDAMEVTSTALNLTMKW